MSTEHTSAIAKPSRYVLPFIVAVDVMAVISIALLGTHRLFERPITLLALLALAAIVGTRPISLPGLHLKVVATDVFMLFALLVLAPAAAPLVALASVFGVTVARGGRFRSMKTAFNAGALPLSMAAGVWSFHAVGGTSASPSPMVVPLLAAAVAYALSNLVLAATVICLNSGGRWLQKCQQLVVLAVVSSVTCALLGASLVLVWLAIGPVSLLLAFVPLVPMQQYYRSFAEHRRESRVDPTIVRELNALPQDEEETGVRSGRQTNDKPVSDPREAEVTCGRTDQ